MITEEKLYEIFQSYSKEDIKSNKKVNVELDYEDLMYIIVALKSQNREMDNIINAFNE